MGGNYSSHEGTAEVPNETKEPITIPAASEIIERATPTHEKTRQRIMRAVGEALSKSNTLITFIKVDHICEISEEVCKDIRNALREKGYSSIRFRRNYHWIGSGFSQQERFVGALEITICAQNCASLFDTRTGHGEIYPEPKRHDTGDEKTALILAD